ncbi:cytidylate kinase-like family protein [Maribellus maritimus]|uniref:cytidylate kinase-like family protein n=1 Tax=Maribellus maritimus TaxID=2870838 RepID=UPI001EEB9E89|nr:cytidylate kinase-like family protein [Maribellus maritimus]MCG6187147.1 cytidylate kinase-like family protein [Maribellus maritimus]
MQDKFYINIGRQIGSGGLEIGKKLATKLNISFYDNELLQIAARESGLGKEFFEQADEKDSHSIFGGLFGMRSSLMDQIYTGYFLSNENLFQIQSDVIRKLADEKSCLFVGRCADYILKEYPRCLNIFISAEKNDRIKRIAKIQNLSEEKACIFVEKIDKKRANYYNYYSNKIWGATNSYHLCINSSVLGIDETVNIIHSFAEKKFGL